MAPLAGDAMPDFDRMAAVFDRYLPLIEPVGSAVLARLPALPDGALVLDVACGTGEPGLTLARRSPGLRLLGVDAAAGMLDVARAKAAREGLANVRFEVMTVEALACADGSVDAVISRFGLLMFGDTTASAKQLARVLRAGGSFSVAVWGDMAKNTLVSAVVAALRPHVPADLIAPFDQFDGAMPVERLHEAGLRDVTSSSFEWHYAFSDRDALWQFASGPGVFGRQFAVLAEADQAPVRSAVESSLAPYRRDGGDYQIPHTCLLYSGKR
jgi:SAM-dependent methyltransferase